MVFEKAAFLFVLFTILSVFPLTSAASEADVIHYSISLILEPEINSVSGNTTVTVETRDLNSLTLSLEDDLELTSVSSEDKKIDFVRTRDEINLFFDTPATGLKSIRLEYEGLLGEEVHGHAWSFSDKKGVFAVYESSWYPNIDGDRASADIAVIAPDDWISVANGAFIRHEEDKNSFIWEVDSPEIGFSFASAKYAEQQNFLKHIPVTCYLLSVREECSSTLVDILEFFSSRLSPYPYPKLALAEVEGNLNGGHGDNSLIILSSDIVRGPKFDEFLAHEAAHSWFGGMVVAEDSKWLTEGFATYAGVLYLERIDKERSKESLESKRNEYLILGRGKDERAILSSGEEYDTRFHATVYSKGAYVLHMLRYVVGDEIFSNILKEYLSRYNGKSASVEDFMNVAEEVSGIELDWFFDEWLREKSIPDYKISSLEVEENKGVYVTRGELRQEGGSIRMPVELTLLTSHGAVRKKIWAESLETEFIFDTPSRPILLDIDKDRWLLESDRENNRHIIRYPLNLQGVRLFFSNFFNSVKNIF
jgi:aminopeptidase N